MFQASRCLETNRYSVIGTYPQKYGSINSVVYDYYNEQIQDQEQEQDQESILQRLIAQMEKNLDKAVERVKRKKAAVSQQINPEKDIAETRKKADLIMINIHGIQRGQDKVEGEDWDTGGKLSVKLDTEKSALEQAEDLYKKAAKQERAPDKVQKLIDQANLELQNLDDFIYQLGQVQQDFQNGDQEGSLSSLKDIQKSLIEQGLMDSQNQIQEKAQNKAMKTMRRKVATGKIKESEKQKFRQFESPNGFKVLIGRTSNENDELSIRVAKSKDMWFHVAGQPGSHTVLRQDSSKGEFRKDDLEFAANLAAFYSKATESRSVPVNYCAAGNVKKPKGAKAGSVTITQYKSISGRPHLSQAFKDNSNNK